VSAKLIFFVVAATAAIGSAVLAGLIVAVVGLSARLPTATLITLIAGTAAAAFGGVIALAGMAASLFFNPGSTSPRQKNSRRPTSRSRATRPARSAGQTGTGPVSPGVRVPNAGDASPTR
jgi:hypothetical protein